ncbi:MAG: tRNA lysidine(34) synthetase TilS [Candidatus Omnitrophica bacterium]|nr:tRNA lysidine(34) synthetase TilS [Candidatus Omnitrophota bacterium]
MVEELFERTITKYNLVKRKEKLMIGVSGGPDSVCLLHLFCNIRKARQLDLTCVHLNHRLRKEADEEEKFVKELCRTLGVRYAAERKDVKGLDRGDSLEQTARQARLDFFRRCARRYKIKKIALAHNKDDVAETVLMRLIRGTALEGLKAIQPKKKMYGVEFIRPIIDVRKKDILDWLGAHDISYKIDRSNFSEIFLRNKVRLTLIPQLEQLNPRIVESLANFARSAAADFDFIHEFTKAQYDTIKKQRGAGFIKLNVVQLKIIHPAILFHLIRLAIAEIKGNTRRLELKHYEQIVALIFNKSQSGSLDMPDIEVRREEKWLLIKSLLFY